MESIKKQLNIKYNRRLLKRFLTYWLDMALLENFKQLQKSLNACIFDYILINMNEFI